MLKVRDFLADAVAALSMGSQGSSYGSSFWVQNVGNQCITFYGYSEEEAEALAVRLCEEVLGVKSYQWILDPAMEVPPAEEARLSSSLKRLCSGEPLQYVLGYADFCGFRFRVGPSVLIPRPETEELCRLVVQEAESDFSDGIPSQDGGCCHGGISSPAPACAGRSGSPAPADAPTSVLRGEGGSPLKILDLCTGSGCIAWSLAMLLPGSEVVGVDVSEEALEVAQAQPLAEEAARRGAKVPKFYKYDILSPSEFSFPLVAGIPSESSSVVSHAAENLPSCPSDGFDIIVSNPPYIRLSERDSLPKNVKNYEPDLALFVPDDDPLIFYRAISVIAMKRLRTGGFGVVEINEALDEPTVAIFSSAGFSSVKLLRDFRAKFRFISFKK